MNPIFGLLTQLLVSKAINKNSKNDKRDERGRPLNDEQKKWLEEYERQDRYETWRMGIVAILVVTTIMLLSYWLGKHN